MGIKRKPRSLEQIAYVVSPSSKLVFSSKRILVNFVPKGECTNNCVFCTPNIPAMKEAVHGEVLLEREYPVGQMVRAVVNAYKQGPDCSEIIITGTVGEPLLYLEKLLKFIPAVKHKVLLPVRLNTNGQASLTAPEYSPQEVCELLERAGLDAVAISLNATSEEDYNRLCRPMKQGAFGSALDFVRASNQSGINTFVSFVDYSNTHPELPRFDKEKIKAFCSSLGIKENQIIYRPLIE